MLESELREKYLSQARMYMGAVGGSDQIYSLYDLYNNNLPANVQKWGTRNTKMLRTYTEYCALFVSAIAIQAGLTSVVPVEIGVTEIINIAKKNGIWQPAGNAYGPQPADLIIFDWTKNGVRDGYPDHIGLIERVDDKYYYTIEGNMTAPNSTHTVWRRVIEKKDPQIVGVISPLYCTIATTPAKPVVDDTAALQNEIKTLNSKIADLKDAYDELEARFIESEIDASDLAEKLELETKKALDLSDEVKKLTKDNDDLRKANDYNLGQITKLEATIAKMEESKEDGLYEFIDEIGVGGHVDIIDRSEDGAYSLEIECHRETLVCGPMKN